MAMRGQVTIEYLISFLIILTVISISIYALVKINSSARDSYEAIALKSEADEIIQTSQELCLLGNGNSREIRLSLPVEIESSHEKIIRVSGKSNSFVGALNCSVDLNGDFSHSLILENSFGTITSS